MSTWEVVISDEEASRIPHREDEASYGPLIEAHLVHDLHIKNILAYEWRIIGRKHDRLRLVEVFTVELMEYK